MPFPQLRSKNLQISRPQQAGGIVLVQTKAQNAGAYSTTNVAAFNANIIAGDFLVMSVTAGSADVISSVTDNKGNAWSLATSIAGLARKTWLWYAPNAIAGATTVTVTFAGSADSIVILREYSGLATSSPLDVNATAADGAYLNAHSAGPTGTTSQANELVIFTSGSDASGDPTFALGSGYSNLVSQGGFDPYTWAAMQDQIVSATGAYSGTLNSTAYVQGQSIIATFKTISSGSSYTPSFTEIITMTDTFTRQLTKYLSEVITNTDVVVKQVQRAFTETLTSTDTLIRQGYKAFLETITSTDTLSKQPGQYMNETLTLTDTLVKALSRAFTEVATLTDTLTKQAQRAFSETITLTDTLARQATKYLIETVTHTDTLRKQAQKSFLELVTSTDTFVKQTYRSLIETITATETLTTLKTYVRAFSETVTHTDTMVRSLSRAFSETITYTDTFLKQVSRLLSETVTLADQTLQAVKLTLKALTETITNTDTFVKQGGKYLLDTVTHTDTLVRSMQRRFSEVATLTDTLLKQLSRSFLETLTYTDTFVKQIGKTLTQLLVLSNNDAAIRFTNGSANRVFVTDPNNKTNFTDTDSYSILVRFKYTDATTDISLTEHWEGGGYPWAIRTAGNLRFNIYDGVNNPSVATASINDGQYHNVLFVKDASIKQQRICVDGSNVANATYVTLNNTQSASSGFAIGARDSGGNYGFNGDISLMQIYKGALSNADAATIQAGGQVSNELVASYEFNEEQGSVLYDLSDNKINGTLTSVVWVQDLGGYRGLRKFISRSLAEVATLTDTLVRSASRLLSETITYTDTLTKQLSKALREYIGLDDGDTIVPNGTFDFPPTFVAAQTTNSRWIDGTATGSAPQNAYAVHASITSNVNVQFDTANKRPGGVGASLKAQITGAGSLFELRGNATFYYGSGGIPVLPNKTYAYSVWMRSVNVTGASASGQYVQLLFSTAAGTGSILSSPVSNSEFTATSIINTNQAWTQYTGTFTTGPDAAWFHPEYRCYGHTGAGTLQGDFYFDDLVITLQNPPLYMRFSLSRTLAELITLTDTFIRSASRSFSETITLLDSLYKQVARSFAEVGTFTDTLRKTPAKAFSDVASLVDSLLAQTIRGRTLIETLTLTDTFTKVAQVVVGIGQSVLSTIGKGVVLSSVYAKTALTSVNSKTPLATKKEAAPVVITTRENKNVLQSKKV